MWSVVSQDTPDDVSVVSQNTPDDVSVVFLAPLIHAPYFINISGNVKQSSKYIKV
jgi:endonuclease IV